MITHARRQESPIPGRRHKDPCRHLWANFRQTITPDNPFYTGSKEPYFIVRACTKCHEKHVIDYKLS